MKVLVAVLLLILIALQVRLWIGQGSYAEVAELSRKIAQQQQENSALRERNNDLLLEVEELKTGMDSIEERAREELGLIKEGETFYLIVENED